MRRLALVAATLVVAAPSAAAPAWSILRAPAITVLGDVPAHDLRDVAGEMEQFRSLVRTFFGQADGRSPEPLVVVVFRNDDEMSAFEPVYRGRATKDAGYFLDSDDVKYIVLSFAEYTRDAGVVNHEYAHLLLANASRRSLPVWLDEGLADYFGLFQLRNNGTQAEVGRPVVDYLRLLRRAPLVPLSEVLATTARSSMYNEGGRRTMFYAEAWALTHYLMVQLPDGPSRVNRYVQLLADGQSEAAALQTAFGMDAAALEREFRHYLTRPVFQSRVVPVDAPAAAERMDDGEPLAGSELDGWLGDLQIRLRRWPEARERLEKAVAADPKAARPLAELALVDFADSEPERAWDEFARAAALGADDFFVQYLYRIHAADPRARRFAEARRAGRARGAGVRGARAGGRARAAVGRRVGAEGRGGRLRPGAARRGAGAADRGRARRARPARLRRTPRAGVRAAGRHGRSQTAADHARRGGLEPRDRRMGPRAPGDADRERAGDGGRARARGRARGAREGGAVGAVPARRAGGRVAHVRPVGGHRVRGGRRGVAREARRPRIVAHSRDIKGVEMTSFVNDRSVAVTCGRRVPPDFVYLTWRANPSSDGQASERAAVAVEFVPGAPPK